MSGVFPPMPLDSTICTAMFGSGAAIGDTKTIGAHHVTEVPGKLAQIITECCVAVPIPRMRSVAAVSFAPRLVCQTVVGGLGVFA